MVLVLTQTVRMTQTKYVPTAPSGAFSLENFMTQDVLITVGGQFVFADHATDYSGGTGNNSLAIAGATNVQIDLTSLAAGAARESNKVSLGVARGRRFAVMMSVEFATAPAAGETVTLFWGPSPDTSAAVGNPGGLTGSDAAYAGYSSNLTESLTQLQYIGQLVLTVQATTTVQIGVVSPNFEPMDRFGILVVVNDSAADAFFTDAVEISISFQPIVDQIANTV